MSSQSKGVGADYLVEKSDLARVSKALPKLDRKSVV